jgi:predicted nuclease with RNAse H fold/dephospho-CoA kinase
MLGSDTAIIEAVLDTKPQLVSIDSPLSLPRGRIMPGDDDPGRNEYGIFRSCERILKRRGINVYPCLLPSMQRLTARGMALAAGIRKLGYSVIECYPGAAQDIIGIPRKGAGEHLLKAGLAGFGITGSFLSESVKHDELDAITSAIVASFFLSGRYEALTGPDEGALIIPKLSPTSPPFVIGVSGHIAAGKTTAARLIERRGFSYTRISRVIDDVIIMNGGVPDRTLRQEVGWRLHVEKGQEWLCERAIDLVKGAERIVVDGLRFPQDHIYFFERFGSRFVHIHIEAAKEIRAHRLSKAIEKSDLSALARPTEQEIEALRAMGRVITNEATLELLERKMESVISEAEIKEVSTCQSRS